MDILPEIKSEETKKRIIERCGSNSPVSKHGVDCPYCGASEVYANPENPDDTSKWAFMVSAFKVDDTSRCNNCNQWF